MDSGLPDAFPLMTECRNPSFDVVPERGAECLGRCWKSKRRSKRRKELQRKKKRFCMRNRTTPIDMKLIGQLRNCRSMRQRKLYVEDQSNLPEGEAHCLRLSVNNALQVRDALSIEECTAAAEALFKSTGKNHGSKKGSYTFMVIYKVLKQSRKKLVLVQRHLIPEEVVALIQKAPHDASFILSGEMNNRKRFPYNHTFGITRGKILCPDGIFGQKKVSVDSLKVFSRIQSLYQITEF